MIPITESPKYPPDFRNHDDLDRHCLGAAGKTQKKAKRETVVIVITFGTVLLSIFIGHYIVTDIISWMFV